MVGSYGQTAYTLSQHKCVSNGVSRSTVRFSANLRSELMIDDDNLVGDTERSLRLT